MKKKLLRLSIVLLFIAVIGGIIYIALRSIIPGFIETLRNGDRSDIERFLRDSGTVKGMILTVLLQFMQIVSIVFPGMPIQIAAGIIFGVFRGFLLCLIGNVAANCAVFAVARRLGDRLNRLLDTQYKTGKFSFMNNAGHPGFVVFISCLMPLLPNGIIPYLAARTKLSFRSFALAVLFGGMPGIFMFCAIGSSILEGQYLTVGIICLLALAVIILLYWKQTAVVSFAYSVWNRIFHHGARQGAQIKPSDTDADDKK